jgi:uncharacterized protein YjbJ (UPF0337 family)
MDNERIEGIGRQVKGALKQGLGKLLGDAKLTADGAAERTAGEAANASSTDEPRIFDVDADRVLGVGHQFKGALKQGFGSLIGNPTLEADGVAEALEGQTQNAAGSARDEKREVFAHRFTAIDAVSQTEIEARTAKELAETKQRELDAAKALKAEHEGPRHASASLPRADGTSRPGSWD